MWKKTYVDFYQCGKKFVWFVTNVEKNKCVLLPVWKKINVDCYQCGTKFVWILTITLVTFHIGNIPHWLHSSLFSRIARTGPSDASRDSKCILHLPFDINVYNK